MLGQHVYIERDEGQEDKKEGLWLSEYYIVDADTNSPYVWAVDKDKCLEKRSVILGQYDEVLGEYEIADGLSKKDSIAYPSELLEEGMRTTNNAEEAIDMNPVEGSDTEILEDDMEDPGIIDDEAFPEDIEPYMEEDQAYEDEIYEDGNVVDAEMYDDGSMEDGMMIEGEEYMDDPGMAEAIPQDEVLVPEGEDMEVME